MVEVISEDKAKRRIGLSTKTTEAALAERGGMIRNPAKVLAEADAHAATYAERKAEAATTLLTL